MTPAMANITVAAEHSELVEEMQYIEKLPVGERIKLAQKRRKQQLSNYTKWIKTDTAGKPVKQKSRRGVVFSPVAQMMEAAARGSYDEMRALLKAGADPDMKNHDGLTALHQCCIDGAVDTVALLLKHGADVNVTDQDLWTPLHAAATCGHFKVVTMLVKAGANVTAVNGDGDMPHDITEEEVTLQYLRNELMKRNISPEDLERIRQKPHDLLLQDVKAVLADGGDLDQPVGQDGETLLHVAIAERYNDVMTLLLDSGASVTAQDRDGWQAVHVAAYWCNEEALELLVACSQVNLQAETNFGETPYELCDDPKLKLDILHILRDRRDSEDSGHTSEGGDGLKDMNGVNHEDAIDRSPPPTIAGDDDFDADDMLSPTIDDALPSPLINIEATELHSDRRSSIKDVKHNAPLKRQSSERSSNRERQSVDMEALRHQLQSMESNENTSYVPSVPFHSPDNYKQFYEAVQPTTQTPDPTADLTVSSEAKSEPDHVTQSPQPTTQTPQSTTETTLSLHSLRPLPEASEAINMKETNVSEATNDKLKGGAGEKLGEGLMLRPRKKNPAPPPPRGSLLDLKRQRQEEREHRLQQGKSDAREDIPYSTFYHGSSTHYEAPPSPSMIRYKYKMEPDDGIKHTIIRERKCTVM